jgi:hypothetical protein
MPRDSANKRVQIVARFGVEAARELLAKYEINQVHPSDYMPMSEETEKLWNDLLNNIK